jgi:hypothetical protein
MGYTRIGRGACSVSNACCVAAEALYFLCGDVDGVAEQSGRLAAYFTLDQVARFLPMIATELVHQPLEIVIACFLNAPRPYGATQRLDAFQMVRCR